MPHRHVFKELSEDLKRWEVGFVYIYNPNNFKLNIRHPALSFQSLHHGPFIPVTLQPHTILAPLLFFSFHVSSTYSLLRSLSSTSKFQILLYHVRNLDLSSPYPQI